MYLSLIGMAGSGKSYWSVKLTELGFDRFGCDDLIEEKLAPELRLADGASMGLAEWMGFPYESNYKTRESRYLDYEIEVLDKVLRDLENRKANPDEKIVIDTTGSVIYTGEEVLEKLRRSTSIVHLSTPPEVKERMLQVYVAQPRPLLWRDLFNKEPDETNKDALTRCYPQLLVVRERLYESLAHVSIDYHKRNKEVFGVKDFLAEIETAIG